MKMLLVKTILAFALLIVGLFVFAIGLYVWGDWYDEWSGYTASTMISDGFCNIAVVSVEGDILSPSYVSPPLDGMMAPAGVFAGPVLARIEQAKNEDMIRGIMVRVDSLGGAPATSLAIANAVSRADMPTAAVVRDYGVSGGYLIASAADRVIASPFSDIGSISMTMSYLGNALQNEINGLEFVSLASGKYKDSGSPDKELTEEERALFERDLKIYHDEFVRQVATHRNLPVEHVARLADGSSLPATLAQTEKLIDVVGDEETARLWFAEELGISSEEVVFCEPLY